MSRASLQKAVDLFVEARIALRELVAPPQPPAKVVHLDLTQCEPGVMVSTVYLEVDHSRANGEGPLWYETMIFGGQFAGRQWRYETVDQARECHAAAVKLVTEV